MTQGANLERRAETSQEIARSSEAQDQAIDERLASLLPEVVDQEGNIDWEKTLALDVAPKAGALLIAKAVPELLRSEFSVVDDYEKRGLTSNAVRHYGYVKALEQTAKTILRTVAKDVFDADAQDERVLKNADGSRMQNAELVMDFAGSLLLQMQTFGFKVIQTPVYQKIEADGEETEDKSKLIRVDYSLESDKVDKFINTIAKPAAELTRMGIDANLAFAIVDIANYTEYDVDEVLSVIRRYKVITDDLYQDEIEALKEILFYVNEIENLDKYVDRFTQEFTLLHEENIQATLFKNGHTEFVAPVETEDRPSKIKFSEQSPVYMVAEDEDASMEQVAAVQDEMERIETLQRQDEADINFDGTQDDLNQFGVDLDDDDFDEYVQGKISAIQVTESDHGVSISADEIAGMSDERLAELAGEALKKYDRQNGE